MKKIALTDLSTVLSWCIETGYINDYARHRILELITPYLKEEKEFLHEERDYLKTLCKEKNEFAEMKIMHPKYFHKVMESIKKEFQLTKSILEKL